MKKLFFLAILIHVISYSQRKICVMTIDYKKLNDVNVYFDDHSSTKTDVSGFFTIIEPFKILKITHLGYETKSLTNTDLISVDTIFLEEESIILKEVTLNIKHDKKVVLPKPKIIDKLKTFNNFYPNFDSDLAVYIPNENNVDYRINKILISVKRKYRGPIETERLPFYVNLMSIDSITKLPLKKIMKQDLWVRNLNNDDILEINLDEKYIFPNEGVFVVVNIPNIDYYVQYLILGQIYAPSFEMVLNRSSPNFISYRRRHLFESTEEEPKWEKNLDSNMPNFRFGVELIK
jgi:hypothetical protein